MKQNKQVKILNKVFKEISLKCEGPEITRLNKEYNKLKESLDKIEVSIMASDEELETSLREFLTKIAKDKRASLAHQIRSDCWDKIMKIYDEELDKKLLLLNCLSMSIEQMEDSYIIENKDKFSEEFLTEYLKDRKII